MPHEVETMTFSGTTPWHGLGTPLAEEAVYNWPTACEKAGLAWDVELAPLVAADTHAPVEHRGVRRKSDSRVLGVVGPRYTPLQNADAFKWFQPFLDAREARLETAGSLRTGARVWVLAKLNLAPIEIARDDLVEKYLLLSHGHDGSLAIRCGFCPVRVVCANTLALAHGSDASKLIRVRHRGDVVGNLAAIREVMNLANQEFEASAEQYRSLARKDISPADQADAEEDLRDEAGIEGRAARRPDRRPPGPRAERRDPKGRGRRGGRVVPDRHHRGGRGRGRPGHLPASQSGTLGPTGGSRVKFG